MHLIFCLPFYLPAARCQPCRPLTAGHLGCQEEFAAASYLAFHCSPGIRTVTSVILFTRLHSPFTSSDSSRFSQVTAGFEATRYFLDRLQSRVTRHPSPALVKLNVSLSKVVPLEQPIPGPLKEHLRGSVLSNWYIGLASSPCTPTRQFSANTKRLRSLHFPHSFGPIRNCRRCHLVSNGLHHTFSSTQESQPSRPPRQARNQDEDP